MESDKLREYIKTRAQDEQKIIAEERENTRREIESLKKAVQ